VKDFPFCTVVIAVYDDLACMDSAMAPTADRDAVVISVFTTFRFWHDAVHIKYVVVSFSAKVTRFVNPLLSLFV